MPDPNDDIAAGFTPAGIVPSRDGLPMPMPVDDGASRELVNLCELGPCVHYHELKTKLDAQEPQDGSAAPIYVNTTRTCYPASGIEFDIGQAPVRDCNLWHPHLKDSSLYTIRQKARAQYVKDSPGEFEQYRTAWGIKP